MKRIPRAVTKLSFSYRKDQHWIQKPTEKVGFFSPSPPCSPLGDYKMIDLLLKWTEILTQCGSNKGIEQKEFCQLNIQKGFIPWNWLSRTKINFQNQFPSHNIFDVWIKSLNYVSKDQNFKIFPSNSDVISQNFKIEYIFFKFLIVYVLLSYTNDLKFEKNYDAYNDIHLILQFDLCFN